MSKTLHLKKKTLHEDDQKGVTIHQAKPEDVDRLVAYGEKFWSQTRYFKAGVDYDIDTVTAVTNNLLDEGVVLYARDVDNNIIALMLVIIAPFPMNVNYLMACEWVFYVDPAFRRGGLGVKLIKTAEKLLIARQVTFFTMVSLINVTPEAANQLYQSLGFEHSESSYTKEISWPS